MEHKNYILNVLQYDFIEHWSTFHLEKFSVVKFTILYYSKLT